jgi:hypothetical protein
VRWTASVGQPEAGFPKADVIERNGHAFVGLQKDGARRGVGVRQILPRRLVGAGAGLLAGLGIMAIPGVGPVVAAGWLVATAVGAVVGAGVGRTSGGIIGSLTGAGVSKEHDKERLVPLPQRFSMSWATCGGPPTTAAGCSPTTSGILLISLSAVAYSSAGFFTRLIHLDAWIMLFWRGLFAGLMILCVIAVQERRNTWSAIRAIGRPGLVAASCSTAATIFYINALRHSSVAEVAVIFAVTCPSTG